jgi:serine/threonine protein kinase
MLRPSAAENPSHREAPVVGSSVGPYRILEQIGAGGMGAVYRAHDTKLQRTVAIKALTAPPDEAARERVIEEARAASALNHPHICTIHEVHEAGDQAFIVMEYIEGRPLSDEIPPGGLPLDTVIRFGTQIADALAHAHERGIVHRDLKSANVLITPDGRAKVLDFGLATRAVDQKLQDVTRSQTAMREAGSLAGTLPYMAPEVLRGGAADARTDVWALGVLLHEMASGARPFTGQTCFELTAAILEKLPASLPPHLPPGFRAIVARALAKEPWHRYPRASDVRAVLETVRPEETADTTARPRPTGAGSGAGTWPSPRRSSCSSRSASLWAWPSGRARPSRPSARARFDRSPCSRSTTSRRTPARTTSSTG